MSRPGDWNCRSCNHLNFQRRESCQRCGEARPAGEYGGRGGSSSSFGFATGADVRPGDWYCSLANCGAHNFASRSTCFKCGAPRQDHSCAASGYDAPRIRPSARPAWKSGDWICTRAGCNEHNFANRMECYRCNAPRDSSSGSRSPY